MDAAPQAENQDIVDPPILENRSPPADQPVDLVNRPIPIIVDEALHVYQPVQPEDDDLFANDTLDEGPPPLLLEAESPEPRPASVETVEVVLMEASPPERRSRRNLQIALRNLVGGMNDSADVDLVENDSDDVQPVATSSSTRKRRRITSQTPSPPKSETKTKRHLTEDDDDGSTCPICLDSWEMSGEHRLVSLKCGHLFGENCIRRWFSGMAANVRCCPSCKSKANLRDIRSIYAKRISVVDKSEEYRLQQLVNDEQHKVENLKQEVALLQLELDLQRKFNVKLEQQLEQTKMNAINLNAAYNSSQATLSVRPRMYKLSCDHTINICSVPGCRVLVHGRRSNNLVVSQKSIQTLFPGFGVRFVDLATFQPTSFLHMAAKQVRDLAFDQDEQLLAAASMDSTCKLFTVNNRGMYASFTPTDKAIWSVAFDKSRTKLIYFGTQHGNSYAYDIRQTNTFLEEYKTIGDMSPVINICSVPPHMPDFPFGGFLVCKLQSLWFYEYTAAQSVAATRLSLVGPFVSMTYAEATQHILIATRPTALQPMSQYVFAELKKVDQTTTVHVVTSMLGSKVQAVMSRSAQLSFDNSTLVAAYLQDSKTLQTWQIQSTQRQHCRMQTIPINDCVLDTCPIYLDQTVYLGALSETKCRIYRVYGEDG